MILDLIILKNLNHWFWRLKKRGYLSYQKIAEIINVFTGVDISRSFVFHQESILSEDYIEKRMDKLNKMIEGMGIGPSGVFNYDEQYLWVNTELKMRMTILDTNTKLCYCR